MGLQIVNIKDSQVSFVDDKKDPIVQLEQQNAELLIALVDTELRLADSEFLQAQLLIDLSMKGVV